ncbi:hypothetical protein RND71_007514 [Anisodus tanguticus]|uniref:Uncharacterized protein n=1 Tax=Anisodus tanguticus TaxID=243964 RepID=A0AAE1VTM4_9SOLA|nr:hypothetical protein RND71_007514 [Anisodus tanguticus]
MEKVKFSLVSEIEENIFHKMVTMDLGIEPSKKVMSFWMFLESHNFNKFYQNISTCDEKFFKSLYAEAETALDFLASNSSSISQDFCPLTSQLLNPSLKEILLSKNKVNNEISFIYDKICCDGFEDTLAKVNLALDSKLNPFANEWDPSAKALEVNRSLFMTFSHGYSFSRRQVFNFFQRLSQNYVHEVFIYKKKGEGAQFGKIVFKNTSVCAWILKEGHRKEAKYYIGSGHVCMKKFETRPKKKKEPRS